MEYFIIGEIARPHGVRGELKVTPMTDDYTRFDGLKYCYIKDGAEYRKLKLTSSRLTDKDAIISVEGVDDRNAAEGWRGVLLYIDRKNAIKLPEGRYFITDLIGLEVITDEGETIGKLADVLQNAAHDIYVVKTESSSIMMPALKTLIQKVDISAGKMTVSASRLAEVSLRED